jgi:hypothetical protein
MGGRSVVATYRYTVAAEADHAAACIVETTRSYQVDARKEETAPDGRLESSKLLGRWRWDQDRKMPVLGAT